MVTSETTSAVRGWLESLKETLHLNEIAEKLNMSADTLGLSLLYFGVGLVAGFLYKRFGRQVVFAIIASVVVLWALSYLDLVSVHMDNFRALAGFSTTDTVGSVFEMLGTWIKGNVIQVVAGIIGLYLGSKVG